MKSNISPRHPELREGSRRSHTISSFITRHAAFKAIIIALMVILPGNITFALSSTPVNNRGLDDVTYTSRANWGADEKWRLAARSEYQKILTAAQQFDGSEEAEPTEGEKRTKTATDYILGLFAAEFKVDRVITGKGTNTLRWSNKYRIKKTKILVHHTADNNAKLPATVAEEKEYMKNLYRYHAFSRGRGDIGYNFIIMPSGRIYEGKAGGAGIIGAHATRNNTPSVGISLVGNFEDKVPPTAQVSSLTTLATSVSKRYGINPTTPTYYFKTTTTFPYIKAEQHQAIAGHKDAGSTKCPGENLYALLPKISLAVADRLAGGSASVATSSPIAVNNTSPKPISSNVSEARKQYIATNGFTASKASIKRLEGAPLVGDIKKVIEKPIPVLLYDASISLEERSLSCSPSCVVRINGTIRSANILKVQKNGKQFYVTMGDTSLSTSKFAVSSSDVITITNYDRKSGKVALNTFRQSLLFLYGPVKRINEEAKNEHHIINVVGLENYMKGIGEASNQQSQTKANVLALLSKAYILYYAGGTIRHPSLPAGAVYVITDDPRISQKYSGAGWEKIGSKRTIALQQTKGFYVAYNGKLPILPYFHCSAGFTRSAAEKRGRTDTPYLQSVSDSGGSCGSGEFEGHGIGLSGDGSSKMADEGKSVKEILEYYYPGVQVVSS